jgi:peptide deformylase
MAVREIRVFGDPVLRSACEPVDPSAAADLVRDLLDTVEIPGRAGVAANQIGVGLRAFSYSANGEVGYLLNPELISTSGTLELVDEGCLSVPGLWHPTPRFPKATVRGQLLDGSVVEISGEGLLAQALQHECDHLVGKLYLDRLEPEERKLAMRELRSQDWFLNRP